MSLSRTILALGLAALAGVCPPAAAQKEKGKGKADALPPVNEKVVAYALKHKGEQVGNGECWTLANNALVAAGGKSSPSYEDAPGRGDYVWGDLVYGLAVEGGKRVESGAKKAVVLPGDVVQFRDVKFAGPRPGGGGYTLTASHHTAVVLRASKDGRVIEVLHQNWNGNHTVAEATLALGDLQAGWLKVYRPRKG